MIMLTASYPCHANIYVMMMKTKTSSDDNYEKDEDDKYDDVDADDVDDGSVDGHRSLAGSPSVPPPL